MFRELFENIQVSLKSDKDNGYFTQIPIYTFFIISPSIPLRKRNASDK